MKHIVCLAVLLITGLNAFAQDQKDKLAIDTTQVSYVELVKVNFESPTTSLTKKLNKAQYADLAIKWNTSKKLGADKYKMKYYVYVYLKNGKKRQFTISDNKIQEEDWLTFDLTDKTYFDKLWNAAK